MSSTVEGGPTIDHRIAARRRTVREAGARRRLRWLLVLLGLAATGGLIVWLLYQSSILSVGNVIVNGNSRSQALAIVDHAGVVTGIPTVSVAAEDLEVALEADPWIAAADVAVRWPGTVEVTVVEYRPAAWVRAGDVWLLASAGGAVLEVALAVPADAPTVDVGVVSGTPGTVLPQLEARAALEFLDQLPTDLVVGASVTGGAGEIRATVGGYHVELGYPSDIAAKAAALVAIFEADVLVEDGVISLVSPQRPAVLDPQEVQDGAPEVDQSGEDGADAAGEAGGGDTAIDPKPSTDG